MSGKYNKDKHDLEVIVSGTRKCYYPFKLQGKPVHNGECWILKVICWILNHEMVETLVGHPMLTY